MNCKEQKHIPTAPLTDRQFAMLREEAEKYLDYPYVWGGSTPETSFDCSGFVCYVINNCGLGWYVGRLNAEDIRLRCSYVSPEDKQPGDLIFFENTYETIGASHLGFYMGNNRMLHCCDTVHYTSLEISYWQSHFLHFGRLQDSKVKI